MRTHEKVLAQIEANLAAGRWGLGERLPGERALAEQMGVSRPSVREALRILEAMGIIRTAVGSGPDAGATVIDRPAAGLGAAVRLHVASGTLPVHDVVATRDALETWAIGEATTRLAAGPAPVATALAEAHRLLEATLDPALPVADFVRLDQDFHLELVTLGGNQVVEAILRGLRSAVGSYVTEGAERLTSWPTTAQRLCTEHRDILEAMTAGDAEAARTAAHEHIWRFYEETGLSAPER